MNNSDLEIDQTEEGLLTYEVSDEVLESAANMIKDKSGSLTVSFCSGLDTCPA
jgi:hypothetical protein